MGHLNFLGVFAELEIKLEIYDPLFGIDFFGS